MAVEQYHCIFNTVENRAGNLVLDSWLYNIPYVQKIKRLDFRVHYTMTRHIFTHCNFDKWNAIFEQAPSFSQFYTTINLLFLQAKSLFRTNLKEQEIVSDALSPPCHVFLKIHVCRQL